MCNTRVVAGMDFASRASLPPHNCCTGLASILQFKHGPSTVRAYFVILAMFVDFFDLTFLVSRERSLLAKLSYICEAFAGHPGHNP
jgi:hypothetical protein